MTPQSPLVSAKIGQLRDEFVRNEAASGLTADDASRLRKFVTWCGISASLESIQPFKVEEFLGQQVNTSVPPRAYLAPLKAFFLYAYKLGAIPQNPMTAVRLPRGSGAAAKKAATPARTPSGRSAQQKEDDIVYVSRERLEAMQVELDRLRNDERHRISQMLHEAIKDGDLSENAGYEDAKMQQGLLEARIRELESKLRNIELIEDQESSNGGVSVGSRVVLEEPDSRDRLVFMVVGPEETNPRNGKISHRSPVGRAIMGKVAGDEVDVTTPGGSIRYRIVSVA